MPNENEILFTPKSVFRIDDVEEFGYGGLWVIKLSLMDPYDSNIDKLLYYYKAKLEMLLAYKILNDMIRYTLAWDMTYTHLTSLAGYEPTMNIGMIYFECAQLWESCGNFGLALVYYRSTLKTLLKVGTFPAYFSYACKILAIFYRKHGMYFEAITTLQKCWKQTFVVTYASISKRNWLHTLRL